MTRIIVDTGPLVAYFNRRDRHHRWVVDQMAALSPPLVTCEPVVTEACFLIHRGGGRPADLIRKVVQRNLEIGMRLAEDASAIESLMQRYADTPMSVADACLVRLTECLPDCRLFTLDADFEHYRRNGRQVIPLLRPA
ncbi:MAG TPA: PIN domain-containing protein [Burkholderiaceae bacterium]|nr:PIN domain-containing protein [Burkholderiaceae bacterium]